ncbi:MAG: hypothetical protein JWQ84_3452 [Mucilaginibacter sp.]|nr:hypothetical protein [Mucilaginibacter sp.]
MITVLNSLLPRLQQYSLNIDKTSFFIDKPWVMIDRDNNYHHYSFQNEGRLITSLNGMVQFGTWEYIPGSKSFLISRGVDVIFLNQVFIQNGLMFLKKDGSEQDPWLLINKNIIPDLDVPNYLNNFLSRIVREIAYCESIQVPVQRKYKRKRKSRKLKIKHLNFQNLKIKQLKLPGLNFRLLISAFFALAFLWVYLAFGGLTNVSGEPMGRASAGHSPRKKEIFNAPPNYVVKKVNEVIINNSNIADKVVPEISDYYNKINNRDYSSLSKFIAPHIKTYFSDDKNLKRNNVIKKQRKFWSSQVAGAKIFYDKQNIISKKLKNGYLVKADIIERSSRGIYYTPYFIKTTETYHLNNNKEITSFRRKVHYIVPDVFRMFGIEETATIKEIKERNSTDDFEKIFNKISEIANTSHRQAYEYKTGIDYLFRKNCYVIDGLKQIPLADFVSDLIKGEKKISLVASVTNEGPNKMISVVMQ